MTYAYLALSAASPWRADAQEVFGGCRPQQDAPNVRFYSCPDWNSSIAAFPKSSFLEEQKLELIRATMRASLSGDVREEGQIKVSGSDSPVLVFVPADGAGNAGFGFAEGTLSASPQGIRLVTCVSKAEGKTQRERCRKALEYLLAHGAPDGADIDAPAAVGQARILSHRLEIPAGCQLVTANDAVGRIQCDKAALSWNTVEKRLVPSTTRWLEETVPVLMKVDGGGFAVANLTWA